MNKIELTKIHKAKLLEMCEALFPEYMFLFHHHDDGEPDKNKSFNYLPGFVMAWKKYENGEHSEYYHDVDIFVHWFEFTVSHLWMKVFPDKKGEMFGKPCDISQSRKHYDILVLWLAGYPESYCREIKNYHPIDYLYSHFIKNKK